METTLSGERYLQHLYIFNHSYCSSHYSPSLLRGFYIISSLTHNFLSHIFFSTASHSLSYTIIISHSITLSVSIISLYFTLSLIHYNFFTFSSERFHHHLETGKYPLW
eukprot:TRINITY_DN145_c0_g1_i10.p2 TRINITY_DN145_c0_g1~~TRINITY_DN145_c0_g1_i10.p2  ORF type:complete len:108 (-),score=12.25 TRINITY_DN145_c0_g1_i10:437-760(-)